MEAEKSGEPYKIQIETLEKTVDKLTFELRASLATQDILKREHSAANKEMESMVIKYAVSEKQLIDTQRYIVCLTEIFEKNVDKRDLFFLILYF